MISVTRYVCGGGKKTVQSISERQEIPVFEQLEPRLLLSAEISCLQLATPVPDNPYEQAIEIDLNYQQEEIACDSVTAIEAVDTLNFDDSDQQTAPVTTIQDGRNTGDISTDETSIVYDTGCVTVNLEPIDLSLSTDLDNQAAKPPVNDDNNILSNSETTSIEIRGPPADNGEYSTISDLTTCVTSDVSLGTSDLEGTQQLNAPDLPGLQLVDPDISSWDGQIIYLDFDGAEDVVYDGPVTVGPFDVPAFEAPNELAGQEQEIINQVLAELERTFAGTGIIFTTSQPSQDIEYSTIYVGGDDSAFAKYGEFLGLAEEVDVGNLNLCDNGFVFSQKVLIDQEDLTNISTKIADTIAHEAGHLIGFSHLGSNIKGELADVSLPIELSLGTPVTGTLDGSDASEAYSIDLDAGEQLFVQLDADNASDHNELYLRYGELPTLTEYDIAAIGSDRSDRFVQISDTQAGTYYILTRCIYDAPYSTDGYMIRADTDATLPTLTLGADSSGELVNTYDFDLYRVEVEAGQNLFVQLDADNASDNNELYIQYGDLPTPLDYDVAGNDADLSDQYAEISGTLAGSYYVMVWCTYDAPYSTDGYVIRADTDATLPTMTLGVDSSGSLTNTYDFDLYRVEVEAGQNLFVQLDADNASDHNELYLRYGALPTLTEYDIAATGSDRSDRFVGISDTQAGTYYILTRCIYDAPYSTDGYVIRADTDATLLTLTLGADSSGELVNTYDFDLYRVEMDAGQNLIVQLDADNAYDNNELYIRYGVLPTPLEYDAAGIETDLSDQYAEISGTMAGSYYIMVWSTYDAPYSTDGYVIRADTDTTLQTLTMGINSSGTLVNTYDFGLYRVETEVDQPLIVQLDADNPHDHNELYLRYGALPTLTEYDAAATGATTGVDRPDRYIEIVSPEVGTYYVLVRCVYDAPYSTDEYVIRADTDATLPTLILGVDSNGTLVNTDDFDLYRVEVDVGQNLIVQLNSDNPYDENELYIRYRVLPTPLEYDVAGNEAGRADQYVEITSTEAGVYYVLVLCTYDAPYSTDGYIIRVDTLATIPPLAIPGQVTGTLDEDGDRAWFMLDIDTSDDVILMLTADAAYPENRLYVKRGALPTPDTYDYAALANGPNQFLMLSAPEPDVYYVLVEGLHVWPQDNFTLSAETGVTLHTLELGIPKSVTVLGISENWYYVDVPAEAVGQPLFVTLQKNSGWSGSLNVTPPDGTSNGLTGSGDLLVQTQVFVEGRFLVQISGPLSVGGMLTAATSLPELPLGEWTVGTIYRTYGSAWYQVDVPADQTTLSFDVETLGLWSQLQVFQGTFDSTPEWRASGCVMHLETPSPSPGRYYVHLTDSAWISGPQSRDHMIFVDTTGEGGPSGEHAPIITGLSTYMGGTSALVTVVISGAWLNEDATVTLERDGYSNIIANYVTGTSDENELSATFDLTSAALGEWTLFVTNPDTLAAQAPQPFTVTTGGEPELWVEIITRETVRVSRPSTVIVRYGNAGSVDAPYPMLVIGAPPDLLCQVDIPDAIPQGSLGSPPDANAFAVMLIDLPRLPAGSSGELSIDIIATEVGEYNFYARITGDPSPYFESALVLPDQVWPVLGIDVSSALDPELTAGPSLYPQQWLGEDPPVGYVGLWKYDDGGWHIAKSIGDRNGNGTSEIIEMWDFNLGSTGDIRIQEWSATGPGAQGFLGFWRPCDNYDPSIHGLRVQEFADELMYNFGDPESNEWTGKICNSELVDDGHYLKLRTNCLGFFHLLNPEFRSRGLYLPEQIYDVIAAPRTWSNGWDPLGKMIGWLWMHGGCKKAFDDFAKAVSKQIHGVQSISPEDKYGPAGYGEEHWIAAYGQVHYRTDFWNKEDALANTQEVIIKDQLDSDLDWSTFSFTRVGFLRWDMLLDSGQYFNVDVDMRPDMDLIVNIEGMFNPTTGEIQWVFRSLDPDTGTWPEDPFAGFLPPITDSGYEIGWVEYTVDQQQGLLTGTEIANQAWVKFDSNPYNPAPKEGPWINTIDAGMPTSEVNPLNSESPFGPVTVSWFGQDDADGTPGSGIATYAIYVSENSGPWEIWLNNTTETSGQFIGHGGSTYSFYCVATDNVGHVEEDEGIADTQTTITFAQLDLDEKGKAQFYDADGDLVTVTLKGGGVGTLYFEHDLPCDIAYIELTGTTEKSSLTIKTKGRSSTTINDIIVHGPLKSISAKTTDLLGDITIDDWLGKIMMDDVVDDHFITIGGSDQSKPVSFKFDQVTDLTIESNTPVKSITSSEWIGGSITAPWISNLSIKGDFIADLILDDYDTKGIALKKLSVAGIMSDSDIIAQGAIGTITAGSMWNSSCFVGTSITLDINLDGVPDLPNPATDISFGSLLTIKKLTIKGIKGYSGDCFVNSNIAAANIGTIALICPQYDNAGIPFGLAADFIKKIIIRDNSSQKSFKNLRTIGDSIQDQDCEICMI